MSPDANNRLERELLEARAHFDEVPVSPDAWQQNQHRLAVARRRRGGRLMAVAAAVVAVVLLGALVASLADQGPDRGAPGSGGSGSDDPWLQENILGEPQLVESRRLDGRDMAHELVLTDTDGSGPQLCDRFTTLENDGGAGGCTPRQPDADDSSVAVDWISGTTGSGDGLHGVVAAVDDRVMKVQVWMDNGDMTLAELHPTGWQGTRVLAFTAPPGAPVPQRLVAYSDASGTVLQAVDLAHLFGKSWLPNQQADCAGVQQVAAASFAGGITVQASFIDARISYTGTGAGGTREVCRSMTEAPVAVVRTGDRLVLVMAPEVAAIRLDGQGRLGPSGPAAPVGTTIWRATVRPVQDLRPEDTLEFLDGSGAVLQRLPVRWII
ncbi:MAG TPA: hypothetical protein VK640_04900 [Actinomycetes bacterium]|nr:hypothetical protein [Actinomycetes bacterium]